MSRCRSCGAPIIWAESATSGKSMPIDDNGGSKDGRWWLVTEKKRKTVSSSPDITVKAVYSIERPDPSADGPYTCHFATCPDADDWRKGKAS